MFKSGLRYFLFFLATLLVSIPNLSYATASTHIWAPSTDAQAFGVVHLTTDMYLPLGPDAFGNRPATVSNLGLTLGVLPWEKVNLELGFDHKSGLGVLDNNPLYFNFKLAIPEAAFGSLCPALAVGVWDLGTQYGATNFNVAYAKAAETLSLGKFSLGRFSAGWFSGNPSLFFDQNNQVDNAGFFGAWERTLTEVSDKLWLCIEYQGGNSPYGSFNYGFSWKFSDPVSILFAVDRYNNRNLADTFTVQVDTDLDLFSKVFKAK